MNPSESFCDNTSHHVKADLNRKLKIIHNWTLSYTMACEKMYDTPWWFARLIYDERLHVVHHVGPYSTPEALIQSAYEKVWFRVWTLVSG